MSFLKSVVTRERGVLAGDACLLTAAAFGLVMGVLALTFAREGEPAGTWVSLLSAVLSLVVVILGPLVAWRLHGRHLTGIAVLGAVIGGFVGSNVVGILVMLVFAPLGWLVSQVGGSELAGLILMVVVVGAAFAALMAWLVADGVRDLSLSRRAHLRLDVLRLISTAVMVVFAIGVWLWTSAHPGDESGEAIIFAMFAGMSAAIVVTGAEVGTSLAARRKNGTVRSGL
jgi:hypothetical protein